MAGEIAPPPYTSASNEDTPVDLPRVGPDRERAELCGNT